MSITGWKINIYYKIHILDSVSSHYQLQTVHDNEDTIAFSLINPVSLRRLFLTSVKFFFHEEIKT